MFNMTSNQIVENLKKETIMNEVQEQNSLNDEFSNKSTSKSLNLFLVRVAVCLIVLIGTMFLKFSNPYYFDNFKYYYNEYICEEKYNPQKIKSDSIQIFKLIKQKSLIYLEKLNIIQ